MREVGEGAMELSLLPSGVPVTVMLVTGSIPGGNNCGGGTEGTDEGHPDGIAEDDCWVPLLLCGEVDRSEDKQLASGGKTFDGPGGCSGPKEYSCLSCVPSLGKDGKGLCGNESGKSGETMPATEGN
jgi:hypothetical protein